MVAPFLPWRFVYGGIQEPFPSANRLIRPFGLAWRPSLTQPKDWGFTNIQAYAYPIYFSAFPAADLLSQDRLGQIRLDALEKVIALQTIPYASAGAPDLLAGLISVYSSSTNNSPPPVGGATNFVDLLAFSGAQATNRLGRWEEDQGDLICLGARGAVEYAFSTSAADVFELQVLGTQNLPNSPYTDFDLALSLDGIPLGHHRLQAAHGSTGMIQCLTPYLAVGPHQLRFFWDNRSRSTQLRLQGLRVRESFGQDANGNGVKDWVENLVNSQSGLDSTNATIASYVSPVCLEGRDPFLPLMSVTVPGADANIAQVTPSPAPNVRCYANVPLANAAAP